MYKGEDPDFIQKPQTNDQVICGLIYGQTGWAIKLFVWLRLNRR